MKKTKWRTISVSGGHFDYLCYRISDFAYELETEIKNNDEGDPDNYDLNGINGMHFSPITIDRLNACRDVIELAGKLAKEVEWLYSGDHSEETFHKVVKEITNKI